MFLVCVVQFARIERDSCPDRLLRLVVGRKHHNKCERAYCDRDSVETRAPKTLHLFASKDFWHACVQFKVFFATCFGSQARGDRRMDASLYKVTPQMNYQSSGTACGRSSDKIASISA
jgi:hypothetical protein